LGWGFGIEGGTGKRLGRAVGDSGGGWGFQPPTISKVYWYRFYLFSNHHDTH
jgi:hypothetical protein